MHPLKLLTIILFLLLSSDLFGQHPALRQYSVDDGLPSSEIYHIFQDSKGYIWLASNMGVSRFDGRLFKNFDVQNGLPENTVFEIYEDETGKVWFVSFPFQLSYFEKDKITPYKYNNLLKNIAEHGLVPVKKCFRADEQGNVFFSFMNDGKIYKINNRGIISKFKQISEKTPKTLITELGGQLLSTQNGVRSTWDLNLLIETKKITESVVVDMSRSKYSGGYFIVDQTEKGEILFAQNELLSIIYPNGKSEVFDFKDRVLWLSNDKNGCVWVGKEFSGVGKYYVDDIEKGPIEHYLTGMPITSVMIDNEGGVWFSTIGSGVFYLSSKAFSSFSPIDGLSGKNIKAISLFKDKVYIGTDDNYFLDVIDHGKISIIKDFGHNMNKIKNITALDDKVLWIGTEKHLHSFDGKKFKKIVNNHPFLLKNKVNSYLGFSIKDIYPLSVNSVMLAQMRSLTIIKEGNVIYDSYYDDNIAFRIESIERETDSTFLLGTFNGLWRLSGKKFQFLGENSELLSKRITDIIVLQGSHKNFVLGTKGSGLIVKINDSIFQIDQSKGLSSNSITSLFLDKNDLWVATNNGLNLIDVNELRNKMPHILVFTEKQGLISNEINQIKGYKNLIYIATTEGLTVFDKSKYKPLKYPPPIYINGVSIMKRDTVNRRYYELEYKQNTITISYSGINFRDAGNLFYKYRLVGLSNNWITTRNLQVEYAFLPPGNYRFEVIAINLEGLMSSNPATLTFQINPPIWKTWWFITILSLIGLIAVTFYIAYRMKVIKKRHIVQNEINQYRQQSLIRQMDPHFVFNTLNSIQTFVINNDSLASTIYLSKFSRLMRLILNNSQKQEVVLSDEIDCLSLYLELESMRFKQRFKYYITLDEGIDAELIHIPTFIIQPFIENSIWHGIMNIEGQGVIRLSFKMGEKELLCSVEDNGVGRLKAMELKKQSKSKKKSYGISIVESRLSILSNFYGTKLKLNYVDLYDDQNKPSGTKVIFNLPIVN